jgi:hypothetical protein
MGLLVDAKGCGIADAAVVSRSFSGFAASGYKVGSRLTADTAPP